MDVEFCLLDVDHFMDSGDRPVIRLWGVDRKGRSVVMLDRGFIPYFYVLPRSDPRGLSKGIMGLSVEGRSPVSVEKASRKVMGRSAEMLKVTVSRTSDMARLRELMGDWEGVKESYEYTIPLYRRYMIDKGLVPMDWVKARGTVDTESGLECDMVLSLESAERSVSTQPDINALVFDIEVAAEGGEERIIMVSFKGTRDFSKVLTWKKVSGAEVVRDEGELISRFVEIVREVDPDIICGYNTDAFDFSKIEERANRHRIPLLLGRDGSPLVFKRRGRGKAAVMAGRVHVDLYTFVENILSQNLTSEVLTLDMVAREILGMGKEKIKWKEIEDAWKSGRGLDRVAEYCMWDSELTLKLAYHLLPQIFELCRVSGQTLFDTSRMTYSQLVEWLLIRRSFEEGWVVPSRPKHGEIEMRKKAGHYAGGYVHLPKEGIHDSIALFDFRSLYPSIIISHNISPETMDCGHGKCGSNSPPEVEHSFCMESLGFVPSVLRDIVVKRAEVRSRMERMTKTEEYKSLHNRQFALKILANAFYGYYGYAGSRWYSRVCALSTTAWGRDYIKKVIATAEKDGMEVLYGDTDSLFLKLGDSSQAKAFLEKVNKRLPGVMELELKGMFSRGIFIGAKTGVAAKKKYALLDSKGELLMRGMETRRRDWARIAKVTQEKVLMAILKDKSPEKAAEIVSRTVQDIMNGRVGMGDLVIYTQLKMPISRYVQKGPHVRAAMKSLERGRPVGEGSTISYIISKGKGTISERAEPAEDARDYDPEYYVHHQVLPPAMRILSGLGIDEGDVLGKGKKGTLSDFLRNPKKE